MFLTSFCSFFIVIPILVLRNLFRFIIFLIFNLCSRYASLFVYVFYVILKFRVSVPLLVLHHPRLLVMTRFWWQVPAAAATLGWCVTNARTDPRSAAPASGGTMAWTTHLSVRWWTCRYVYCMCGVCIVLAFNTTLYGSLRLIVAVMIYVLYVFTFIVVQVGCSYCR